MDATDQRALDLAMIEADGTENKGRLGANAILGHLSGRGEGRGGGRRAAALTATSAGQGRTPCPFPARTS